MRFLPVIGLETHVQLSTKTKLFCGCSTDIEKKSPNSNVCPICLAHPGTLPVPNNQAIRYAVLLGLALNGNITAHSKFDRKHYFYPDLPKAYQISQFDLPVMRDGYLDIEVAGQAKPVRVGLERMHLEEDAGKNIHGADGHTYVDFNRGGAALCEIVTKPDIHSAAEAKAYLYELRLLVRTLGVSDGDMEKGQLRCDVNISLREVDDAGNWLGPLNTKTELKNLNSFRAVERAIQYEVTRQTELWAAGTPPLKTTTRGWNDVAGITEEQRVKEDAADYRFFPEPDIPPLELADLAVEMARLMPEMPAAKRARFISEFGFKADDARQLVENTALANFTEQVYSELMVDLEPSPKLSKLLAGWLLTKLTALIADRKVEIDEAKITPAYFAEFLNLIASNQLTAAKGLEVLGAMLDNGWSAPHTMESLGAVKIDSSAALQEMVADIMKKNPNEVTRYKNGEAKLLQFFLGQLMRATKGNADPDLATQTILDALA
ncbi:TPA: Asp-tRNA(Asn)/Glu-tRNA(Gln) amidotransferase GatCAB subunit B [Candidatus Uhrbacteria bacterium]|nr:Asp-tRNA(Asn)/Glu-tRNA(Gln) amidotransferase GatCAB subunit B [Candidatus Uhrbacteria bacterium]